MENKNEIKYCVCAFIDLIGFASHLEVGADLRTTIGQEAIQRLKTLEEVLNMVEKERTKNPDHYPKNFDIQRLNDALVLTMDLPATLKPEIGDKAPYYYNRESNELLQSEISKMESEVYAGNALKIHSVETKKSVHELMLFVGLISRIHTYIFYKESIRHFPGPKTIVVTGYRASFFTRGKEDYLSANFAFANAYKAELKLKGSGFFVDDTILRLLSVSQSSFTIVRYSILVVKETGFNPAKELVSDPINDLHNILYFPIDWVEAEQIKVELFRNEFIFREINPNPLFLFQLLSYLEPYLRKEKEARTNPVFRQTFEILRKKQTFDEIKSKPRLILFKFPSLDKDIGELFDDFVNSQSDEYFQISNH